MDIRAWRYAVTLAEELHFGRAARRHFLAEAHFGRQIRRLEEQVGERLFDRTSRRVALTPAGRRLIAEAIPVITAFDALARGSSPERGDVVRLGVLGFGLADLWERYRDEVVARCPGIRLQFVELDLTGQYGAVQSGKVDVAIVQELGPVEGLRLDAVLRTPRVVAVPAGSRWASATMLEESDLRQADWLPTAGFESWVGRCVGPGPGTALRSPAAVPLAVAATGLACLHAAPAAHYFPHPAVRYQPIGGPACSIAIATRDGDDRETVAAFRAAAQALAPGDGVSVSPVEQGGSVWEMDC